MAVSIGRTSVTANRKHAPKRSAPNDAGLRGYDGLTAMKFMLEEMFGRAAWYKLKETRDIQTWQTETIRLLRAIELSVKCTIEIADQQWRIEMSELIKDGIRWIGESDHIDDLLSHLTATLARIVFLQIGHVPRVHSRSSTTIPLIPRYWTLNGYRTVQYVQTAAQSAATKVEQDRLAENIRRIEAKGAVRPL
jgi:hypothetical protein